MIPTPFRIRLFAMLEAIRTGDLPLASRLCETIGRDLGVATMVSANNASDLVELTESTLRHAPHEVELAAESEEFVSVFTRSFGGVRTAASHVIRVLLLAERFAEAEGVIAAHGFKLRYADHLRGLADRPEKAAGIEYLAKHVLEREPEVIGDVMLAIYSNCETEDDLDRCIRAFRLSSWSFASKGQFLIRPTMAIDLIPRMVADGMGIDASLLSHLCSSWGGRSTDDLSRIVARAPTKEALSALTSMIGRRYSEPASVLQTRQALRQFLMARLCEAGYGFVLLEAAFQKKDAEFAAAIPVPARAPSAESLNRLLRSVLDGYQAGESAGSRWRDTIAWLHVLKKWGADFGSLRRPMRETVDLLMGPRPQL